MTVSSAPIEAGIGAVVIGKQSALGTAKPISDTNYSVLRLKTSDLGPNAVNGQEEWVDGLRWSSPAVFRDTAGGAVGSVAYQAQIETVGQAWAFQLGSDTVTGGSDPYTHTIDTNGTAVVYVTARTTLGANVGPERNAYIDSRVSKTEWVCSQDQNVAQITQDLVSINPSVFQSSHPSQAGAAADPVNWPQVTTNVKLNGVALPEVSGETVTADLGITGYWGDSVTPAALVEGKASPQRGLDTIVTADVMKQMHAAIYGTQTPTGGSAVSNLPTFAAMDTKYVISASRSVQYVSPRVGLDPSTFKFPPSATGGTIPVSFSGPCLKSGATAALTVIVLNGDATSYIA